ncbi:MAG TPA: hypothetical protein VE344_03950 [Methylomirabilota bacterium]|nr:hypothetical protein [Methylomirabilota bacterium]
MNATAELTFLKCACQHCGVNIEFPADYTETMRECPKCGKMTALKPPPPKIRIEAPENYRRPAYPEEKESERIRSMAVGALVISIISLVIGGFFILVGLNENYQEKEIEECSIGSALIAGAVWIFMISQIIHIRANTTKD